MKKPLSTSLARTNLTDREIAKIIGGLLGGLLDMTDIYSLRHAVQWLADTPEFWHELEKKPFDRERFDSTDQDVLSATAIIRSPLRK